MNAANFCIFLSASELQKIDHGIAKRGVHWDKKYFWNRFIFFLPPFEDCK